MSIEVRDLSFSYHGPPILEAVSFDVPPGTVTALFGPNGTGKSTLFRCVLGMLPHAGTVTVDGRPTHRWSAQQMARQLAFVPQDHHAAFPHSVRDMVVMGRTATHGSVLGPSASDVRHALEQLDALGLVHLAERSFATLSGGQRQLVLVARALAQDAPYLLLDEPAASLDFGNQVLMWQTVRDLAHLRGKGVLVCSHDPNHVLWFCDRAVVLSRGAGPVAVGPVRQVLTQRTLRQLYPDESELAEVDGISVVLPGAVRR